MRNNECIFCKEDATNWDIYFETSSGNVVLCQKHFDELRNNPELACDKLIVNSLIGKS